MHRFIVELNGAQVVALSENEAKHAVKVLRLKPGDPVSLSDGQGKLFEGAIDDIREQQVTVRVLGAMEDNESPLTITLYQGLPKAEKMEFIVQKATELGVSRIVCVRMRRSVIKVGSQEAVKKSERYRRIAAEAVKQCGRAVVPVIEPAVTFAQAVEDMKNRQLMVMPWEEARGVNLTAVKRAHPDFRDIGILIGPEGGIDKSEAECVMQSGGHSVTLGPRILRTETAAVLSVGLIQQLWGDM